MTHSPTLTLPFSVVAKPTGAACNLDCQYCFFLSKELLYDQKRQTMSEETLETYVKNFLSASLDGEVTMLWQGGEPTLRGLPFFERLIELCEKYRRPTQEVRHAIQTNGTLITPSWASFFKEHNFLVGISIDGPAPLHDAYRLNRGGHGTHSMVIRGWEHLRHADVDTNILCTIHAANEDHGLEVYRYFRDELGAQYMQFIPIVERVPKEHLRQAELGWRSGSSALLYRQDGDCVTSRSTSPQGYGNFLCSIFDEWVCSDVGSVFVQDFDSSISALFGSASVCVHASTPAITGLSPSGLWATLRTAISQPLRLRKRCVLLIRRSKIWMMNAGAVLSCVCAGADAQRTVSSRPILGLRTITCARDTGISIPTLSPTSKRWPS